MTDLRSLSSDLEPASVLIRSLGSWHETIARTYFELDVAAPEPSAFRGTLRCRETDAFGLSIVRSTAVSYCRRRENCQSRDARILATFPLQGRVHFSQFNREVTCGERGFFLEASDEPYELVQGAASRLLVLRTDEAALRDRVRDYRRYFARPLLLDDGLGRLFADFLALSWRHIARDPVALLPLLGPKLLDLLAATLESGPQALASSLSAVKAAHLARAERYIDQHLHDPSLSLERIAGACGVSLRYLHRLFQETGSTGREMIRDRRLRRAHDLLRQPTKTFSIASLAYRVGFGDQASFSRAFKAKFGITPRECRGWLHPA